MRCRCCDVELTDFESTRKTKTSGEYLDICNSCYQHVAEDIPSVTRADLANKQELLDLDTEIYQDE